MLPLSEYDPPPGNARGALIKALLTEQRDGGGIPIARSSVGYELLTAAKSGALGDRWKTEASRLRIPDFD